MAVVLALVPARRRCRRPRPEAEASAAPGPSPAAVDSGVDLSGTMPNSTRDDLTGDFLGKGYDQRMRVEGNGG